MSDVEMSLDDIIKKKRVPGPARVKITPGGGPRVGGFQAGGAVPTGKMADARNKIISKRRTQITDARDKLAQLARQKDARVKLEQMRLRKASLHKALSRNLTFNRIQENHGRVPRNIPVNIKRGFTDVSRQVSSRPLRTRPLIAPANIHLSRQIGYSNTKSPMRSDRLAPVSAHKAAIKPAKILRTVENDVFVPRPIIIDEEYEPAPLPSLNRKTSLNLKIIAHNDEIRQDKINSHSRKTSEHEKERGLTSILKKRPMAALRMDKQSERTESSAPLEYRIVVSNLRSSVTGSDIQELFGDVGGLLESRLVRPGTAEVIYKSLDDAQRAVDLYHNRQLDGQPMNCLLVNPRSQSIATSGRLGTGSGLSNKPSIPPSGNSSVVPDIDTFHKVLFSRH